MKRNFCDDRVWTRFFPEPEEAVPIIADENDEREWEAKCEEAEWRRENGLGIDFALPGSNSAVRASGLITRATCPARPAMRPTA